MDHLISLDQHTLPDQQTTLEQQTAIVQEPTSDQFQPIPFDQITQEGNEAFLRQHQRHLRASFPSCDLSEVSYHTEHTEFPGSRHSSLTSEPLTLDAEQIHDAKDQAVDFLQKADSDKAFQIFTKDTLKTIIGRVSMMEYYWRHGQDPKTKCEESPPRESEAKALEDQISTLVDKAQQVVEANEQQSGRKISGAASDSLEEKKRAEEFVTPLEEDVKQRAD